MITGALKSKVDRIWDTMWSGGISNPLSVIEQLTYLLFIKRLDELHTREEHRAARTGHPIAKPLFTARQDALRWSRFKELAPERMFETVRDRVFPFIKSLGQTGDSEEGSTYTHHMQDAFFMMPTARVLANVVDQLDDIDMADRDTKGDLYEYMLGKIATSGQNGQFRTPRHIIRLMVDMTAPTPKDVICDPACGTAGFLVAASEHLVEHHGDRIYKNAEARRRFNEGTFHGYDFDTTMLRIGSMNMLLHGVENPDIRYRDSLAQTDLVAAGDDAERYSLVLANPPFAGSLDYESTAKDLQQGRQDEEDRAAVPGPVPAPAPDRRPRRRHRARRRTVRVEQSPPDAAQDPGRGAEARRHRLHAVRRLQTLRRGLHRDPALHQDQLRRHARRLVLRYAGRRLLAGRQAHPATGEERPCRHPRPLGEPRGGAQAGAGGPEFLRAQGGDCGQRLRPLHQPLQGCGVRGRGVRPTDGNHRAPAEAGGRNRGGAGGVGGDVEMSWLVATVGEVCDVVSGATPRTGKPEFWGGNIPWATPKDLSELGQKHLSDTPRKITKAGLESCSVRMLPAQSVLFSSRAPIGLVAINTLPVCTNQGFKSLVPRFDLVSPDFLFWWLKAQEKHIQSKGRGATFKEISKKIVEDLQIPLPPLAEQKRIAAILDAADALRAKRREALAQLDTLLQSIFLEMFGDPVTNPTKWDTFPLGKV